MPKRELFFPSRHHRDVYANTRTSDNSNVAELQVHNLLGSPVNAVDNITASAYAINNGTDLEMGTDYV